MQPYLSTARMAATEPLRGSALALLARYVLPIVYTVPLILLWRGLFAQGVAVDMTLSQMLTYTVISVALEPMLNVRSPASGWLYEGIILNLYMRPMGILRQLTAMTMGMWGPHLLLLAVPVLTLAGLLGVTLVPATLWAVPSLLLSISLGFAVEYLFSCILIRMINAEWMVYTFREAVTALLSGAVIPFALLPWGIGDVLRYLPFGSLAGAPLSIWAGIAQPLPVLLTQLIWNVVLWPLALLSFRSMRERMVSHGG